MDLITLEIEIGARAIDAFHADPVALIREAVDRARRRATASSRIVAALERVWSAIQRRHPDVPDVVIIVGIGSTKPGTLTLGHFGPHRWTLDGLQRHELMIGGEGLARGSRPVLGTLLHEATHGVAAARDIKDTSRQGRYHNAQFKTLAEELGIEVTQHPVIGWSLTTLPDKTAEDYADELVDLTEAMMVYRRTEWAGLFGVGGTGGGDGDGDGDTVKTPPPVDKPKGRSNPLYVCGCEKPRKLRMARSTFEAGPITCGVCGDDFEEHDPDAAGESPAVAPAVPLWPVAAHRAPTR